MAKATREIWEVEGIKIPVTIIRERRLNNRISITKKGVNLRVPWTGARFMKSSYESWARNWLKDQLSERPDLASRFTTRHYVTGYIINTPYKNYVLDIQKSRRATSAGKLINETLSLDLNDQLVEWKVADTIRSLISRLIGRDQLPRVKARIHEFNNQFFHQEIKDIRIKNNSSNWGSCSTNGNINISSKTLLAPFIVQDYIFVHELAHRLEMNHSPRYWALVANVMPSYKKHEKWIKKNGHLCEI